MIYRLCEFNSCLVGTLCGECQDGMGVSVLFNECVTCHNAQALLILALSRFI